MGTRVRHWSRLNVRHVAAEAAEGGRGGNPGSGGFRTSEEELIARNSNKSHHAGRSTPHHPARTLVGIFFFFFGPKLDNTKFHFPFQPVFKLVAKGDPPSSTLPPAPSVV